MACASERGEGVKRAERREQAKRVQRGGQAEQTERAKLAQAGERAEESERGEHAEHARWRRNFFLTRVLGHLLDTFRLTVHTYTYGSRFQRFTHGGDAFFFDARSGPPA